MRVKISALVLLVGIGLSSCTDRDSMFGNDMVPPSQLMKSVVDSTVLVNTYIVTTDSIGTNVTGNYSGPLGTFIDPLVGRTDISFFTHYAPDGFAHSHYFGENPVIDSMSATFVFTDFKGDSSRTYTIDVYEVKNHDFYRDSAYYSNFNMAPYIDQPLVSYEQKGFDMTRVKLPMDFALRMLDNTQSQENVYYSDTAFHKRFKGLYFKVREPVTQGEGFVASMDLSQSAMFLFYHNDGPNGKDTLEQKYWFVGDYAFYNMNFVMVDHDFSYSDPSQGGVVVSTINDTINPSEFTYIQGYAGLMGRLEIDSVSLNRINEYTQSQGYAHAALHKAELQMHVVNADWEEYEESFTNLGVYFNIHDLKFITDYNPILESISGSGYASTLGGGLNRSRGIYRFDITSYVQQLLIDKEDEHKTQLLPSYDAMNYLYRSWLYGSASSYPPKLIITYTMIK